MRVAIAQINPTLGDFKANAQKIVEYSQRAKEKRADIVVFSELALFGYPAMDLLERAFKVQEQERFIRKISSTLPRNITVVYGAVTSNPQSTGKPFCNSAIVSRRGEKIYSFAKQLLPSYDIFDETRFFEPGTTTGIVKIPNVGKIAVTVCEDMWGNSKAGGIPFYSHNPLRKVSGVSLVVNISASPYSKHKDVQRLRVARAHAVTMKTPFVYVNQVGGQDEVLFDGRSFVLSEKGKVLAQATCFEEDLLIVDLKTHRAEHRPMPKSELEVMRRALVVGIQDFLRKTGQSEVHLGLSGGIDSALVACLAVDAVGPSHVTGFLLPGPYSSEGSIADALKLADHLKIKTHTANITSAHETLLALTKNFFTPQETKVSIMEQNIQARLRGLVMMCFSNVTHSMLLSTSNKSEMASGYATLYGDMCGGLAPIADLTKNEVYELARLYNSEHEVIPKDTLTKPPSAELAPDQTDQDTLPPYDRLDRAVNRIVERKLQPKSAVEKWLQKALDASEFKRWQAPPILRISEHAFGRGRRMPIAGKR